MGHDAESEFGGPLHQPKHYAAEHASDAELLLRQYDASTPPQYSPYTAVLNLVV